MTKKNLVIIGGGGAGLFTGATILQLSKEYDVYMISDENLYCRCSSPYILANKADLKDAIMPDSMITNFGIKLLKGVAKEVDYKKKIVKYGSDVGTANIKFDKLVFATGARPFVPQISGNELKNVFSVRTSEDIKKIYTQLKKVKSATVIGGGVIGVEIASVLKERGINTTMLIVEDRVFERIADVEFANIVTEHLINNKLNVVTNSQIKRVTGESKVEGVIFEKEGKFHTIKSDLVIYATGVRANKQMAESIGVKTNNFGILVDDTMKTNLKDVYAVGDCAVTKAFVTKKNTPSQLATNSVIQGKLLGKVLAGMKVKYTGHTSATILQFLGLEFGSAGVNENMCKELGIDYYIGISHSTDIYQDLKGAHKVIVKLLFSKKTNQVIGVEGFGKNLVWIVNLVSFAIQQKTSIQDLINLDYASHPSVTPWPFMDPIVDASEHAMQEIMKS